MKMATQNIQMRSADMFESVYTIDDAVDAAGYGKFQIKLLCLSGLGWCADAFEILILSLLGTYTSCQWEMHRWQNAMLTSMVFVGIMVGCTVFGSAADIYGRKRILLISMICVFVLGSLSAASPSFGWLLAFRCLTGLALGGLPQAFTLCSEYNPPAMRGKSGFYLCYFWSLGTISVVLLAWVIMKYSNNWRIFLAAAALPALIVIISMKWYPESARYYLVSNKYEDAKNILKEMADANGKSLPTGRLVEMPECSKRGRFWDLFAKQYRVRAILFMYIWYASAFSYYGIALLSPIVIARGSIRHKINETNDMSDIVLCTNYTDRDYIDLLWTSAAEFPGILIFAFLVEKCGRKVLMSVSCVLGAILTFLLLLDTEIKAILLICLFGARGITVSTLQLSFVMMAEAFPTTVRSIALGLGSGVSRVGGLTVPYVSQVLVLTHPVEAICVLATVVLLQGLCAALLPIETRGAGLEESHSTKTSNIPKN